MKISNLISNHIKEGKTLKIGHWSATQTESHRREIYHYDTMMCLIYDGILSRVSHGRRSLSDKQGVNKLFKEAENLGYEIIR